MAACPSCHANFAGWSKRCPRCGASLEQLVPDLEARPRSSAPSSLGAAPMAADGKGGSTHRATITSREERQLLEPDDDLAPIRLELDVSPRVASWPPRSNPTLAPRVTSSAPPASSGPPRSLRESAMAGTTEAPSVFASAPSPRIRSGISRVPAATSVEVDPGAALALAGHGPAPMAWYQTPRYALQVLRRHRVLRQALGRLEVAVREAELQSLLRYRELGAALRPLLASDPRASDWMASHDDPERAAAHRATLLGDAPKLQQASLDDVAEQVVALDAELSGILARLPPLEEAERHAEADRQRHVAKRKRVDIEVRAAKNLVEAPDTEPDARLAAEQVIARAQAQREARQADEQAAALRLEQARQAVAAERRRVAELERRRNALRDGQLSMAAGVGSRAEQDSKSTVASEQLVQLGRRAFAEGPDSVMSLLPAEMARSLRKSIVETSSEATGLQREVALHRRALEAADASTVRRGLTVLAMAIALLFVAFVAWRLLRTNPYLSTAGSLPHAHLRWFAGLDGTRRSDG